MNMEQKMVLLSRGRNYMIDMVFSTCINSSDDETTVLILICLVSPKISVI